MQGEILGADPRRTERLQQRLRPRRRPHPRRVRDADLVRPHLEQAGRDVGDGAGGWGRGPFEGAAQRDGDVGSGFEAVRFGAGDEGLEA